MNRATNHTHIADALSGPIAFMLTVGMVVAASLALMDLFGLNVGICLAVGVNVVWGFLWRRLVMAAFVLVVLALSGGLVRR